MLVLKVFFISEAGMVVIFGARNNDLGSLVPPFWHPGEPSEAVGAAGRTHGGSESNFLDVETIWEAFF